MATFFATNRKPSKRRKLKMKTDSMDSRVNRPYQDEMV